MVGETYGQSAGAGEFGKPWKLSRTRPQEEAGGAYREVGPKVAALSARILHCRKNRELVQGAWPSWALRWDR